jgi:hypothetical protein
VLFFFGGEGGYTFFRHGDVTMFGLRFDVEAENIFSYEWSYPAFRGRGG